MGRADPGEGDVVEPPSEFLPGLKKITVDNYIPLIIDEIQTGLGRTGQWFASEWDDVTPDAMPLAKAIGGIGLPLAATIYHDNLNTWDQGSHVGTFRGNVPAMVAGIRAVEYIQDHDLLSHAQDIGNYMRDRLRDATDDISHTTDTRCRGLFIGVEFVTPTGEPDTDLIDTIREYCYQCGVLVWSASRHNNVLRLIPLLDITSEQAEIAMDIVADAIEKCAAAE